MGKYDLCIRCSCFPCHCGGKPKKGREEEAMLERMSDEQEKVFAQMRAKDKHRQPKVFKVGLDIDEEDM